MPARQSFVPAGVSPFGLVADDHGRANFGPNFEEKSATRGARETGVVPLGRPPGGLPM